MLKADSPSPRKVTRSCLSALSIDIPISAPRSRTDGGRAVYDFTREGDPAWPGENRTGAEFVARFEARPVIPGFARLPDKAAPGLLARVYELNTKLWDDHGFFRADRVMLPDLDREAPLTTSAAREGFVLPHAVPAAPIVEQSKGFYRFTDFFHALESGVHDFAVDSCGPVLLVVGGQDAIAETGVFHQHQTERRGSVVLGTGWHPVSLRLGSSPAELTVTYPDGQTIPLDAAKLHRTAAPKLPANSPEADLLARVDFSLWDGRLGVTAFESRCRVCIADFAHTAEIDGRRAFVSPPFAAASCLGGVDINMTRGAGRVPLMLHFLEMREPSFTVGGWFRSETGEGQLFGKQGLTASGKP